MFSKITIVPIPVEDQHVSKAFYTTVLGCKVVEDMPFMPGSHWIRLEIPGVDTRIVLANWFQQMPPGSLQGIVLITDGVHKTCAQLKRQDFRHTPA